VFDPCGEFGNKALGLPEASVLGVNMPAPDGKVTYEHWDQPFYKLCSHCTSSTNQNPKTFDKAK